jgi:hypothetical protein
LLTIGISAKDSYDRNMSHHERGNASEKHFLPKVAIGQSRGTGKDFLDKEGAASAGGFIDSQ